MSEPFWLTATAVLTVFSFEVAEPDFVAIILALADGTLDEAGLATWIRDHWPT